MVFVGSFLRALFVRPWLEARVDAAGRSSSRRFQAAAVRNGGQGRRRLAPGPEPRGPAQTRRLAGSTGSMERTHPLTAVSTVAPTLALHVIAYFLAPRPAVTEQHSVSASRAHARLHARAKVSL